MQLRLPTLAAALLCASQALAQSYEPGLLVRSSGDTLRGEIENGFWNEPPTFIHFRPGPDSPSQLFQPRQLKAVAFTTGRYFRYEALPIDHAADTQLSMLRHGLDTNVKIDSLLAEVLIEGSVTLFRVARPNSVHFLLKRAGQPVLEMCERQYLRQSASGAWAVVDGNNYRSQLTLYFGDCPAAVQTAQTATFTPIGMAAVVQAYNQTCSPTLQAGRTWLNVATPRRRVSLQGGILVGARYNRLLNAPDATINGCTDCATQPFAGLYSEVLLPGRRAAIYGELSLGAFRNRNTTLVDVINTEYTQPSGEHYSVQTFIYGTYDYRALLGTARIGARYFFPLPHEQQIIFGVNYELVGLWNKTVTRQPGTGGIIHQDDLTYSSIPLMPSLTVGWRLRRFSVAADAQSWFTGKSFVLRGSVAYRLGRNHDKKTPAPTLTPAAGSR